MSGVVEQGGGVRVGAEVDVLSECVESLREVPRPPDAVEVSLLRTAHQEPGFAWLGFVTYQRAGIWERNGMAVRVEDLPVAQRAVVKLADLAERVASRRWAFGAPVVTIDWQGNVLALGCDVVAASNDDVPPVPIVTNLRDRVYLAPRTGAWSDVVVETEQGRIAVPPPVVAHLQQRNASVVEFGLVDGDVYAMAQAEQRGRIHTSPVVVAPVELLTWTESTPDEFRDRRRGGNEVEQLVQALDPETPVATLLELLDTSIGYIRRRVAAHPGLPTPVMEELAQYGTAAIRSAVGTNPDLPSRAAAFLAADPEASVRAAVAANARLDLDVVLGLSGDQEAIVRAAVVLNPTLPPDARAALGSDSAPIVRIAVAAHTDTPSDVLVRLAHDVDPSVCAAAGANAACPPETLDELVAALPAVVLANPSVPGHLLVAGARTADPELRSRVGSNPATPERLLTSLARDRDDRVLRAVLGNPSTPKQARQRAEKRLTSPRRAIDT
jgi:hypothetical protein